MARSGLILLLMFGAFGGMAQTLTCTFQFSATGTIGTSSFTDAAISITTIGNTTNRKSAPSAVGPSPGYYLEATSASIAISGKGTFTFTVPTSVYISYNGSNTLFLFDGGAGTERDLVEVSINGYRPWDMLSSVAPITATGEVLQWAWGWPITTNGGQVNLINHSPLVTFQATVTATPSGPALTRAGALPHVAVGGGWTMIITVLNTSSSPVQLTVSLYGDDGKPLTIPVTTTQEGVSSTSTTASVNATIPSKGLLLLSAGDGIATTVVGWADVMSSGQVGGFAIFRQTPASGPPSEGTVPLVAGNWTSITLPYDDTAGFVMGVALANLSTSFSTVTTTIWNDNGTQLGTQYFTIPGNGHTSFVLPTQFPATIAKRGFVQFQSASGLAGLGLRFSPFGTFTSVPTI